MAGEDVPANGTPVSSGGPGAGGSSDPADGVSKLSLATRTVHADDGISAHRAIAPALHVSTTFRYNRDPDELRSGDNVDVSCPLLDPQSRSPCAPSTYHALPS